MPTSDTNLLPAELTYSSLLDAMAALPVNAVPCVEPLVVPASVRDKFGDEAVRVEARKFGYCEVVYTESIDNARRLAGEGGASGQ